MSHPTDPLTIVQGHTGPQALLIVDDEGNGIDVSTASGSNLEFIIRDSMLAGEADIVRLEEADGLTHVSGTTGKVSMVISTARWSNLLVGIYAAQFHYVVASIEYWSHPFLLKVVRSFS